MRSVALARFSKATLLTFVLVHTCGMPLNATLARSVALAANAELNEEGHLIVPSALVLDLESIAIGEDAFAAIELPNDGLDTAIDALSADTDPHRLPTPLICS